MQVGVMAEDCSGVSAFQSGLVEFSMTAVYAHPRLCWLDQLGQ